MRTPLAPAALAAAVLGAAVLGAGCRDALLDPPPPSLPAQDDVPSMYLKGPDEMRLHTEATLRGEPVSGAASFLWTASGTGQVQARSSTAARVFTVLATERGTVHFAITAFDAEGRVLARGGRRVAIR
ncbi:MAG: hypothetical protein ACK41D_08105 [Rubricoccaceae bacterium]